MVRRLVIAARALIIGWIALFLACFLAMRLILFWSSPLIGAPWRPTLRLILECGGLTLAGWAIGRWNRRDAVPVVSVFAILLAVSNFGLIPDADIPWLIRLTRDVAGSARYLESWGRAVLIHGLLFGSLFVGARLSRPASTGPASFIEPDLR